MSDASIERLADLSAKLTRLVGRRVDVVELKDIEAEAAVLAQVVGDGRVLVDRQQTWPRLRRREASLRRRGSQDDARRLDAALGGIDDLLAS